VIIVATGDLELGFMRATALAAAIRAKKLSPESQPRFGDLPDTKPRTITLFRSSWKVDGNRYV